MTRSLALALALTAAVAAAACGDSAAHMPDAKGGSDSGMIGSDAPPAPAPFAVAVAGDFMSTGVFSTLDVAGLSVTQNAVAGVAGSDPYLRVSGGALYIINRAGGDNLTILDASSLVLQEQLATDAGSNPQDVAVVGDKLYLPALGTAGVVVLTRGASTSTTIDLATSLGDPDGKPDCVSAYAVGTDVYVACDLLDESYMPRGPGQVAVIDTTTDTVRATVALPYANPQSMFVRAPQSSAFAGDLLIPTVPDFGDYSTGCLARVSVGATPTASCAITNQDLGGFVNHADVDPTGAHLYLAVTTYDASSNEAGALRPVDLATGEVGPAISAANELILDVAACSDGSVVAADRTTGAGGLRVFTNGAERTTDALPIGLLPSYGNSLVCYDRGRS